jgi:two-component system chemotaxis response regulator CheB
VNRKLRVLIVDDSAFSRKVLREILNLDSRIEVVDTARDGVDALEKISALAPDVITLDLVMPNLDGIGVLAALPAEMRTRVVVVSFAATQSDLGLSALAAGAFDLVQKPTGLATARLHELSGELLAKVVAAGSARAHAPEAPPKAAKMLAAPARSDRIVVVGTSTGGPPALSRLLGAFPAEFPAPIAIVLHIPAGYTGPLAERLDSESALEVCEASDGMSLRPGRAILARAGLHMRVQGSPPTSVVRLDFAPHASVHRPSVDALFESAADTWGKRVVAVVLTGMGDDGLRGARSVHAAGGIVLAESEWSCVVYGMPRVVVQAGLATAEVPLSEMGHEIQKWL